MTADGGGEAGGYSSVGVAADNALSVDGVDVTVDDSNL